MPQKGSIQEKATEGGGRKVRNAKKENLTLGKKAASKTSKERKTKKTKK